MIKYRFSEFIVLSKLATIMLLVVILIISLLMWNNDQKPYIIPMSLLLIMITILLNHAQKIISQSRKLKLLEPNQRQKLISIWLRNSFLLLPILIFFRPNTKNIYLNIALSMFIIYLFIDQLFYTYKLIKKDFKFVKDSYPLGNSSKEGEPIQVGYLDFFDENIETKVIVFKDLTYRIINSETLLNIPLSELNTENQNKIHLYIEEISQHPKLKNYYKE